MTVVPSLSVGPSTTTSSVGTRASVTRESSVFRAAVPVPSNAVSGSEDFSRVTVGRPELRATLVMSSTTAGVGVK